MSEEKISFGARLKGTFADRGSKKILIVAAVAIIGGVAYFFSGSSAPVTNPSQIRGVPDAPRTVQGGAPVNPAYDAALSVADRQRADQARNQGASSLPTIRGRSTEDLIPADPAPAPERPEQAVQPALVRPDETPSVIRRPAPLVQAQAHPQSRQAQEQIRRADEQTVAAMSRQMNEILSGKRSVATVENFYKPEKDTQAQQQNGSSQPPGAPYPGTEDNAVVTPLPGTIVYARLVGRVTSDAPGPVLAELLEGPYAGATLIGSFKTAQDAVVISFDRMTIKRTRDGQEINRTVPINSVAVDVKHLGTAMATDVDRHLFEKVAIGFASAFAGGLGEAIQRQGEVSINGATGTVITARPELNTSDQLLVALGQAGNRTGTVLNSEFGNRPTTITVDGGVPIGILFL